MSAAPGRPKQAHRSAEHGGFSMNAAFDVVRADLVQQAGLIDGEWVRADDGRSVDQAR